MRAVNTECRHVLLVISSVTNDLLCRYQSSISAQSMMLCLLPFNQVAGEVLAKGDYTPVLSIIDPLKSFLVGQAHLQIKRNRFNIYIRFIDHILHLKFPQPASTSVYIWPDQIKFKGSAHYVTVCWKSGNGSMSWRETIFPLQWFPRKSWCLLYKVCYFLTRNHNELSEKFLLTYSHLIKLQLKWQHKIKPKSTSKSTVTLSLLGDTHLV